MAEEIAETKAEVAPQPQLTYENITEAFMNLPKGELDAQVDEMMKDDDAPAQAEESEEPETKEAPKEEKKEAAPTKVKIIQLKVGDKTVDVPNDALIPIKINGKIENLTIEEAGRRASGDVAIEKRHDDLRKKELTVKEIEEKANIAIKNFADLREPIEQKDFLSFLQKTPEILGLDPVDFEVNLLSTLGPIAAQWNALSEEEKKSLVRDRKVTVLEKEKQDLTTAQEAQVKNQKAQEFVAKYCEENKIEQPEFIRGLNTLRKLKEEGQLDHVPEITPDVIKEYLVLEGTEARIKTALAKVVPSLADDANVIGDLLQQVGGQNPDDSDLEEIVRAVYGDASTDVDEARAEEKLNKKLNKTSNPSSIKPPPQTKTGAASSKVFRPDDHW